MAIRTSGKSNQPTDKSSVAGTMIDIATEVANGRHFLAEHRSLSQRMSAVERQLASHEESIQRTKEQNSGQTEFYLGEDLTISAAVLNAASGDYRVQIPIRLRSVPASKAIVSGSFEPDVAFTTSFADGSPPSAPDLDTARSARLYRGRGWVVVNFKTDGTWTDGDYIDIEGRPKAGDNTLLGWTLPGVGTVRVNITA